MTITLVCYLYAVFFILAIITDRLPFASTIKNISGIGLNSLKIIRSDLIDDSEKEKILLNNSLNMFKQSLKMFGFLMIMTSAGFLLLLPGIFFNHLSYKVLLDYMVTYNGLLISVLSFFSYFLFKNLYVKIRL